MMTDPTGLDPQPGCGPDDPSCSGAPWCDSYYCGPGILPEPGVPVVYDVTSFTPPPTTGLPPGIFSSGPGVDYSWLGLLQWAGLVAPNCSTQYGINPCFLDNNSNLGTAPSLQQVQQTYSNCVSNFENTSAGKVVDFGSVLSFARDFWGAVKNWSEAFATKTVIYKFWYHGGKTVESPVEWLTPQLLKGAAYTGVAAATELDLGAHAACWQASTPARLPMMY